MKRAQLLIGAALALTSVWAIAQEGPESLLPPGYDAPAAKAPSPAAKSAAPATKAPAPAGVPTSAAAPGPAAAMPSESRPIVQQLPGVGSSGAGTNIAGRLPSLEELETLSPEDLAKVLGLATNYDMPTAARREMKQVGVLAEAEGGLRSTSLAGQDAALVRAAIEGNNGALVSRWGHILLRRALSSRLDAPANMNPADFAAMRAALLIRMGEGEAARAIVQDIDAGNYTPALTQAALDSYIFTADFTGICPAVAIQGDARKDPEWQISRGICAAFQGEGSSAMSQLDRALFRGTMPRIDVLLAQKYAGAAGKARRAVRIEWDNVSDMTPWRYAMAIAVGLEPPASLMANAGPRYDYMAATAPMLGLAKRAAAADRAAGAGILSSAAMVDLYSQIYSDADVGGDWGGRADLLRSAYVAGTPAARLSAMQQLWNGGSDGQQRYSRQVLTAYAAARMPTNKDLADDAGPLIASMLSAGLDRNALRWGNIVPTGGDGWAMLIVGAPNRPNPISESSIESFYDNDRSDDSRKTAFLIAGLAGLGRMPAGTARSLASTHEFDLYGQTRWTRLIRQAAQVDNAALVALLAGLGMQGTSWDKMTPRFLYNIVSALRQVGLEAEARMIAAEAVARA
jgi:hypothetical protein